MQHPFKIYNSVRQIPIYRARARSQCVHSAVSFVTSLTRSVSFLLCINFRFVGQFGKCIVMQP